MDESGAQLPGLASVGWHLAPGAAPGFSPGSDAVSGRLVKRNRRRSVYWFADSAGRGYFVKHDHPSNPRDLVKTCWRLKGQREFTVARRLFSAGIATPEPVAWGRRGVDTFVVTRELPGISEFVPAWRQCAGNPSQRARFVAALAEFLARLLAAGIHHPDMHAGNLVVGTGEGMPTFSLLDVYGVRIHRASSPKRALAMLCWLNGWARGLLPGEREILFVPLAAALHAADPADAWRKVLAASRIASRRRWPGLRRRLLKPGSIVAGCAAEEGRWLLATPFALETAQQAIAGHQANENAGDWLKDDVKRRLSRVACGGRTVIVKEYISPRGGGRWRSDAQAWTGAFRLFREGFPVAAPLAWLRARDGRGYIILADGGGENLPNTLRQAAPDLAQDLLAQAGKILADLHNYGICHGDTKTTNFVVANPADGGKAALRLVDCDAVKFVGYAARPRFAAEVARFVETIPGGLPENATHAFTAAYAATRI